MKIELKRQSNLQIKSWLNDKPISTSDWEVFASSEGETENILLVHDTKSGNKLKIIITKYENFEEND
jgi:hypothetical protein